MQEGEISGTPSLLGKVPFSSGFLIRLVMYWQYDQTDHGFNNLYRKKDGKDEIKCIRILFS